MIPRLLMSRTYGLPAGVFFLIVGSLPSAISSSKWVLDNDFENNQDRSELLWEKDGISLIICCSLCDRTQSCVSFFHLSSLMKCVGSQSYKRGLPAGQAMQQGWKYYTKPQRCDGDYVYNQTLGLCYKIHYEEKNFSDAMVACETEGAKLIIIRNEDEFLHIAYAVNGYNKGIWIGLWAMVGTREWNWWNGRAASYIPWYPGQPDSVNIGEYCVMIYDYNKRLHDQRCYVRIAFICQRYV